MWLSASSRVKTSAVTSFSSICSSSQQNFSQELCSTNMSKPVYTVLCSTHFTGFFSLSKILLLISHRNPPLCQIRLLLLVLTYQHLRSLGASVLCTSVTACACMLSHSLVSDSLRPHGLQPSRLFCPWEFSRQECWNG